MMLENIKLYNFKSYESWQTGFNPSLNAITGGNGSGKTNLLDAIHYLALTKSAFSQNDRFSIQNNTDFFLIQGHFFFDEQRCEIRCGFQTGKKKEIKNSKIKYEKNSEHIGRFPVVFIAPQDSEIITGGSEDRRRFFDNVISQVDIQYLHQLMQYNYVLKQRNQLLKRFAEDNTFDKDLLESYDYTLVQWGEPIVDRRRAFINQFREAFKAFYREISTGSEEVDLQYNSNVEEGDFNQLLINHQQKDRALQRTYIGIHRDEYPFMINGYPLKQFGSQGQQKSFLMALKLAQFRYMENIKGFKPLLLLDDIFDKLDDSRIQKLNEMIRGGYFGQVFLTDARPERTYQLLSDAPDGFKHIPLGE